MYTYFKTLHLWSSRGPQETWGGHILSTSLEFDTCSRLCLSNQQIREFLLDFLCHLWPSPLSHQQSLLPSDRKCTSVATAGLQSNISILIAQCGRNWGWTCCTVSENCDKWVCQQKIETKVQHHNCDKLEKMSRQVYKWLFLTWKKFLFSTTDLKFFKELFNIFAVFTSIIIFLCAFMSTPNSNSLHLKGVFEYLHQISEMKKHPLPCRNQADMTNMTRMALNVWCLSCERERKKN